MGAHVKMVCHVWDGALWEMPDQICMMTRESPGMKGRQSGTSSSSANGYESLLDPNVQVFSRWLYENNMNEGNS